MGHPLSNNERDELLERESHARASAERAVRRIARLQSATAALSEALSVEDVAKVIMDEGLEALEADAGTIAMVDAAGENVEVCQAVGYSADIVDRFRSFPVDASVPLAEAIRTREIILIGSQKERNRQFPAIADQPSEYASMAVAPLIADGRAIGAMGLSFVDPKEFFEGEKRLIKTLAQQCAQAMERARLYEAEREARSKAEASQANLAFLAAASEALSTSLDYRDTLKKVAELVVPRLADWCAIDLLEDDGSLAHLVLSHVDPDKVRLAYELREKYPTDPSAEVGVPQVIRTGEPLFVPEVPTELLEATARDEEHLRLISSLGLRSTMIVPLALRGRVLGAITLVTAESGRIYDDYDLTMARELARRAAMAIENARLFSDVSEAKERFAHVARTLQRSLLPPELPSIPGVEIAARYRAAGEGNEVGGDFYDAFQTDDGSWSLVLGDVMGKGPKAAALTGLARHTIRAIAGGRSPAEVLRRLSEAILAHSTETEFATVVYGLLEREGARGKLTIASGGHHLPFVLRANGLLEKLDTPGMILGALPDPELTDTVIHLDEGDCVVFYSDGVIEEGEADQTFGEQKLMTLIESCARHSATDLASAIESAVVDFRPEDPRDDIAILVLRLGAENEGEISTSLVQPADS